MFKYPQGLGTHYLQKNLIQVWKAVTIGKLVFIELSQKCVGYIDEIMSRLIWLRQKFLLRRLI